MPYPISDTKYFDRPTAGRLVIKLDNGEELTPTSDDLAKWGFTDSRLAWSYIQDIMTELGKKDKDFPADFQPLLNLFYTTMTNPVSLREGSARTEMLANLKDMKEKLVASGD